MTSIWNEELSAQGVKFFALDPGDMDTPMHAIAVPDADRAALKQPQVAAAEIVRTIVELLAPAAFVDVRRAS